MQARATFSRAPTHERAVIRVMSAKLSSRTVLGLRDPARRAAAQAGGETTSVVLVDDRAIARGGLRMLLERESGLRVLGECATSAQAERCVDEHRPDVLIVDLEMSSWCALDAIAVLRLRAPDTQIVALAASKDPELARRAMSRGALGYLLKDATVGELVRVVRGVARGESYLAPAVGARIATEEMAHHDGLSARELEVLRLLADGHTNSEIASRLNLSVRTVDSHRVNIQRKVRLRTRAQLVAYAREQGLVAA